MKLIIDIPKEDYRKAIGGQFCIPVFFEAVKNGTPLPKGHGRLKDIDKVEKLLDLSEPDNMIATCMKRLVDSVPTIIEADTESEGEE